MATHGYKNIECQTHAECWSHCRRYFYESIPIDKNGKMDINCCGHKAIEDYIDKLFKIERKIANLSEKEKVEERQKESKTILEEFFQWVNSMLEGKIITNEKLKKALTYASNQEKELSEFLNDGRIPLSNNRCENHIRPFAVHRKAWLFSDSVAGAEANAVIYSIIESAKSNKLNIYKYITYLLEELPQLDNLLDEKIIAKYLPWSEELPKEILNFQGTYEELKIDSNLIVEK